MTERQPWWIYALGLLVSAVLIAGLFHIPGVAEAWCAPIWPEGARFPGCG